MLLCPWGFPGKNTPGSGLPCPSPGDLPDPGIKPASLMSPGLAGGLFTTSATWEALRWSPFILNDIHTSTSYDKNILQVLVAIISKLNGVAFVSN